MAQYKSKHTGTEIDTAITNVIDNADKWSAKAETSDIKDGKLSITVNGTTKTFSANQDTDESIEIDTTSEAVSYGEAQSLTDEQKTTAKTNIGLENVANTGDSATPVEGGTTKFTTGGAYTELNRVLTEAETYADEHGGKIENVEVNGVEQEIENKTVYIDFKSDEVVNDVYNIMPSTTYAGTNTDTDVATTNTVAKMISDSSDIVLEDYTVNG